MSPKSRTSTLLADFASISPQPLSFIPVCYLATDQDIWTSQDDGESWNLTGSLGLIWDVIGGNDLKAFAGSNGTGVYYSNNLGMAWSQLNTGIEDKVIWDITADTHRLSSLRASGDRASKISFLVWTVLLIKLLVFPCWF